MGFLSIAGTWPSSPFYDFPEGNPQSCLLLPQSCLPLTPALPRAEYMHGKHGVNVEVQGPHEARDGQLLIRLDLNRKEVLTLRLRNGGTQPVTLTHLFPFCRTPQFSFCNGDRELPCLLGPGEWVLKEPLVARNVLLQAGGACLGVGAIWGMSGLGCSWADPSPTRLTQLPSPR